MNDAEKNKSTSTTNTTNANTTNVTGAISVGIGPCVAGVTAAATVSTPVPNLPGTTVYTTVGTTRYTSGKGNNTYAAGIRFDF